MKKTISIFMIFIMLLTIITPTVLADENKDQTANTPVADTTSSGATTDDSSESIIENHDTTTTADYDEAITDIQESEWYQERLQEMEQERLSEMNGINNNINENQQRKYNDNIFKDKSYKINEEKSVTIDIESLDDDIKKSKEKKTQVKKQVYVEASENFDITTIENAKIIKTLGNGYVIEVPVTQINELVQNDEVTKVVDENSIKTEEKEEQKRITHDYQNRNIKREHLEVKPEEIEKAKEQSIIELKNLGYNIKDDETISPYLFYFLDTSSMPTTDTIQDAYDESSSIIYLSDKTLWGVNEKWITPNAVYDETPSTTTNPTQNVVSDCEEHAITFVAMARQQNVPAENVRVATGYVEIGNEKFGHAWAQIKLSDGTWMNVEPTSGSYIENNELIEHDALGLYYYKDKTYPVVEIWGYFNDKYYTDSTGMLAPEDWKIQSTSYNIGNQMTPTVAGYFDEIITWAQQEMYLILN